MRRFVFFLLLGVLIYSSVMASTDNMSSLNEQIKVTADVIGKKEKELLPVYSAPDENAFRGADGKAAVSMSESFHARALNHDGNWLLIEYAVSDKVNRIGWIRIGNAEPPRHEAVFEWEDSWDFEERRSEPEESGPFDALVQISTADLMVITRDVDLTDDPDGARRSLRKMESGETVGGMGILRTEDGKEWGYIRTTVEGKKAFGFVPADAVRSCPNSHLENDTLVVEEGIELLGLDMDVLDSGGFIYLDGGPVNAVIETGVIQGCLVDEYDWMENGIRQVRLPDSLEVMGDDALYNLILEELVIPEGVRYIRGFCPLMAMQIGTLYFPSTLEDFKFYMRYTNIGTYVLNEDNPNMTCVDGVIFSKDRKVLLSYPNARAAESYNVPKGTEEIAEHAFYVGPDYDGYWLEPVPLHALSLPLGLKKIGYRAFSGLDELVSLTIPPTVETLSEHAFGEMASLQFLNMPDRLKNAFYWYWMEKQKSGNGFRGDNGEGVEREQ